MGGAMVAAFYLVFDRHLDQVREHILALILQLVLNVPFGSLPAMDFV